MITSLETLDAAAADLVRRRIALTQAKAAMEAEIAAVQKKHQAAIVALTDDCASREEAIREYCDEHRGMVFLPGAKSRETPLATFGFRFDSQVKPLPKIKPDEVVDRLMRLPNGDAYLTYGKPSLNKNALHAARPELAPEFLVAAGLRFVDKDHFYFSPKPETAQPPADS